MKKLVIREPVLELPPERLVKLEKHCNYYYESLSESERSELLEAMKREELCQLNEGNIPKFRNIPWSY